MNFPKVKFPKKNNSEDSEKKEKSKFKLPELNIKSKKKKAPPKKEPEDFEEKEEKKFKSKRKVREYDEFYKKRLNWKKIGLTIALLLVLALLAFVILVAKKYFENIDKDPVETPPVIELTPEEQYIEDLHQGLTGGVVIGTTTKAELVEAGVVDTEKSGENFLIRSGYTEINKKQFFTTYLLKDGTVVGIVHESMADANTKYNLNTEFQTLLSDLNRVYSEMEISKRWFTDPVKYDGTAWNDLLIENKLELVADIKKGDEFIKIVASGVPYFDYMHNNEYDQSFGNLVLIYTNSKNSKLFEDIDSISF